MVCFYAAAYGQRDVLKWILEESKYELDFGEHRTQALNHAIGFGNLETVEFLLDCGCDWEFESGYVAAFYGHLAILQLLDTYGFEWHDSVTDYAAAGGHLECIEWLLDKGCHKTASTCKYAAGFGQLDTVEWLRLGDCPWDKDTTTYASTDEVYNWAKSNGCPVAAGNPRENLENHYAYYGEPFTHIYD
jgi:hypothetical protein